jgi:hypothetical protein
MTDENITLCPGCGTELYDAADKDGLCEDCQPEPEEDDADNSEGILRCKLTNEFRVVGKVEFSHAIITERL